MIKMITNENKHLNQDTICEIFRLRKKVFADHLGWDVKITGDLETDEYDDLDCIYLASIDPSTNRVQGAMRLMPTVGPHLMKDVFANWFTDDVVFESPSIWEVTRFCIDPNFQKGPYSPRGLHLVSSELLIALAEVGVRAGLKQVTALCHSGMIKMLQRSKWRPDIVATSSIPRTGKVYLGLWDVSEEVVANLQIASGLGAQLEPTVYADTAALAAQLVPFYRLCLPDIHFLAR